MHDPEKLNRVLGAKLWWRWLRGGKDLWKAIWMLKYNMPDTTEDIQQKERLNRIQDVQHLQEKTGSNRKCVKDYWKSNELDGIWRKWTDPIEWDNELNQKLQEAFMKEVNSRKIRYRTGKDILRWGNSTKGTFTVKEEYPCSHG